MTSGGLGTKKRTIKPMDTETIKGMILAPCGVVAVGFDSAGEGACVLSSLMARRGVNLLERDGIGERGENRKGLGLFRDENLGATTVSGGLKEEEEGRERMVDERVRR